MPVTRVVADALGVVTICLVVLLVLVGLFCIVYIFYFRSHIRRQGLFQLSYFSGPWIIRISYIVFALWWGIGEIIRLNLWRHNGRVLDALTFQWQEKLCEVYIISNLGFAEPCLYLTLVFLLRASLQSSGTLNQKWNVKTGGFILLYCFPIFILQLVITLIGPKYKRDYNSRLPSYFVQSTFSSDTTNDIAFCTYPLLSTIILGLFSTVLTLYVLWLGRRILHLVINKGLQMRVYTLIFSISNLFPLRVVLLGLSVLTESGRLMFDVIAFLAFLSLLCCVGVGVCMLVYLPIADSLDLRSLQRDAEVARREVSDGTSPLLTSQSPPEGSHAGRSSSGSGKCTSVSFRAMERDEAGFVELSLFDPSQQSSPPVSPRLVGWPSR